MTDRYCEQDAEWTLLKFLHKIELGLVKMRKGLFHLNDIVGVRECMNMEERYGKFTNVEFSDNRIITINQTVEEFQTFLKKELRKQRKCGYVDEKVSKGSDSFESRCANPLYKKLSGEKE